MIDLRINKLAVSVEDGTTVAAAILAGGIGHFRSSTIGSPRGPLCGIGVCFECRVTIDGVKLQRSCNVQARDGMEVETDD